MGTTRDERPDRTDSILGSARDGDRRALDELFARHHDRLRRMVDLRLDRRLRGRLDPSDVLQEAYVEVVSRVDDYLRDPKLPPFLWLRLIVGERLTRLHRHHLGVQARDAGREISFHRHPVPAASSAALAAQLLGRHTSPSHAAIRAERMMRVQEALASLDPIDREAVALRHFEQLSRAEAAQVLGISEAAAAKRYIRALKRLEGVLAAMPGGLEGL
jgi:RNA polymerase sigma-70 factor (ECF subfamily)